VARVLILSRNVKEEILNQLSYVNNWHGQFIVPIPKISLYDASGIGIDDTVKSRGM
jgi:hypothetical protein